MPTADAMVRPAAFVTDLYPKNAVGAARQGVIDEACYCQGSGLRQGRRVEGLGAGFDAGVGLAGSYAQVGGDFPPIQPVDRGNDRSPFELPVRLLNPPLHRRFPGLGGEGG